MRILPLVQSIFAAAFILFGLVALFGIGITGLLFLAPGAVFAVTASITQKDSRAGTAVALAVDAVLATMAARKLAALGASGSPALFDYLPPALALVLIAIGALGVVLDWRSLRNSPWF